MPHRETFQPYRTRLLVTITLIALLFSFTPVSHVQAAAGDLDPTFGNGGKVTINFGSMDTANAVAIQPDGKVVVAGYSVSVDPDVDFTLLRYNPNGSLDLMFGSGGKVITDFPIQSKANAVAIQPDGKIVAAGSATNVGFIGEVYALARYDASGNLDPTFGNGGKATKAFTGSGRGISDIALQSDGKIVAAGTVDTVFGERFGVARFNSDGSVDSSFGDQGIVITDFSMLDCALFAIAIQPDNKIVAAGQVSAPILDIDFALARYNSDGSPDLFFGTGGKLTIDFSGNIDAARAIAIQPNGKIIVAGFTGTPFLFNSDNFALVRLNSDGSFDLTFGSGGKVTTDLFGRDDQIFDLAIQPNGKIIAVGSADHDALGADFGLARYNGNGSLDTTFGDGGKVITDFFGGSDRLSAVALQQDGKIIAAGTTFNGDAGNDFALARYKGDPTGFDICLQDDRNGNLLQFNSITGDYQFNDCRKGITLTGNGTVKIRACKIELRASGHNLSITALANPCTRVGTASVQSSSPNKTYTINDSDITNNICGCR